MVGETVDGVKLQADDVVCPLAKLLPGILRSSDSWESTLTSREVATSGLALPRWVPRFLVTLAARPKHASDGSASTGDVTSACCTQFAQPRRSANSHRRQYWSMPLFRSVTEQEN